MGQKQRKIKQYFWRIRSAKYKRGFDIHSPFVFDLIMKVLREKSLYYGYGEVERLRDNVLCKKLFPNDFLLKKEIHLCQIRERYGRFLFRMINYFQPKTILEVGTSIGIDTLYMVQPNDQSKCTTIEKSSRLCNVAASLFEYSKQKNICLLQGEWVEKVKEYVDQVEQLDFVCCNVEPLEAPVEELFNICRGKMHEKSVFIFKGVQTTQEHQNVWNQMIKDKSVVVAINMYSMGLLFFDSKLTRKNYKLYF